METTLEKSSAAANAERKADSPAMSGSASRHRLVIEKNVPTRAKWQRGETPHWTLESEREMAAWEWRLLLQMNWLKPDRRREIIKMVAAEACAQLIAPCDLPEKLKADVTREIIETADRDSMPNDGAMPQAD